MSIQMIKIGRLHNMQKNVMTIFVSINDMQILMNTSCMWANAIE